MAAPAIATAVDPCMFQPERASQLAIMWTHDVGQADKAGGWEERP
jgi:hypothetical protein